MSVGSTKNPLFDFGESEMKEEEKKGGVPGSIDGGGKLKYPLDPESLGALERALEELQIKSGQGNKKIAVVGTTFIENDATETTVLTASVPGKSFGTSNAVFGKLLINSFQLDSGTCSITVKYGGVTATGAVVTTNFSTNTVGTFDFLIVGNGATNSQTASSILNTGVANNTASTAYPLFFNDVNTITIDSNDNQDLEITVKFSAAAVNNTLRVTNGFAELIRL